MSGRSKRCRVLIADDETIIADTLAQILNASGFEAEPVYSGEKAVEVAQYVRPDAFIADVVMGEMSGIESAVRIKRIMPDCKIILLSGQAATASLLRNANTEGHRFEILSKPVHPRVILDMLTEIKIDCQPDAPSSSENERAG
ncbi:MAG TPA: response regulator [Terracidiphilus sp.]|nr:response regulator [Terracidiphilus sp.]